MNDLSLTQKGLTVTNEVTTCDFQSMFKVRIVTLDGNPWFVASDVYKILGIKNTSDALKSLDPDERSRFNLGRQGEANIVSESGLYTIMLRCRDATKEGTLAHSFKRWVTREVLPAIRKSGSYRHQYDRMTNQQAFEIVAAIRSAFTGWCFTGSENQALYNRIRAENNISKFEDLPADRVESVLATVKQVRKMNHEFLSAMIEIKKQYLSQFVGAGAPWTPDLKRKWLKKFGERVPEPPNWVDVQQKLAH